MKEKIATIAYLLVISIMFTFVVIGFVQILLVFSISDGVVLFITALTPSFIALSFAGFYLAKAILKTIKVFKKVVVVVPSSTDK